MLLLKLLMPTRQLFTAASVQAKLSKTKPLDIPARQDRPAALATCRSWLLAFAFAGIGGHAGRTQTTNRSGALKRRPDRSLLLLTQHTPLSQTRPMAFAAGAGCSKDVPHNSGDDDRAVGIDSASRAPAFLAGRSAGFVSDPIEKIGAASADG
jgi:hypothetical protein